MRRQRDAVATLRTCGVSVAYEFQIDDTTKELNTDQRSRIQLLFDKSFGVDWIHNIEYLSACRADCDASKLNSALQQLFQFGTIKYLELSRPMVDNGSLQEVGKLTELEYLDLRNSRITDAALAQLASLQHLRVLSLDGCTGITDSSVEILLQLRQLELLIIRGTLIGPQEAARLEASYPAGVVRCD